jgi:hypothetical protein
MINSDREYYKELGSSDLVFPFQEAFSRSWPLVISGRFRCCRGQVGRSKHGSFRHPDGSRRIGFLVCMPSSGLCSSILSGELPLIGSRRPNLQWFGHNSVTQLFGPLSCKGGKNNKNMSMTQMKSIRRPLLHHDLKHGGLALSLTGRQMV